MLSDIDLQHNTKAVCPYCGEEQSWVELTSEPFDDFNTTVCCEHCGQEFEVMAEMEIYYTSRKIKVEND